MTIDLLVQNTVVHNFLRIPQSTFPTLPSTVEMESSRSSTQTMTTTSSNIVQTFVLNTICRSLRNDDWFTGAKECCSQFFANSVKYVSNATVHIWNGIKPFFNSNNDVVFFKHRSNFRLNSICRSLRNDDWFTDAKDCCSQFFANSAKYVSNAIVDIWNRIKPFFNSNNDVVFF